MNNMTEIYSINIPIRTYRAFLHFVTAGISVSRPSAVGLYFFRSSSSRTSSDICSMSTRTEHWISESSSDLSSDIRKAWNCWWTGRLFKSVRQWKMLMLLSGEILSVFISFRLFMTLCLQFSFIFSKGFTKTKDSKYATGWTGQHPLSLEPPSGSEEKLKNPAGDKEKPQGEPQKEGSTPRMDRPCNRWQRPVHYLKLLTDHWWLWLKRFLCFALKPDWKSSNKAELFNYNSLKDFEIKEDWILVYNFLRRLDQGLFDRGLITADLKDCGTQVFIIFKIVS